MSGLLEIEGVSQDFRSGFWLRRKRVLDRVSFSVREGAVVGILGPNGAGKTTLIHLIAGIRRPSGGRVLLGGKDVSIPSARAKMGYLPERPYFPDHLTGVSLLRYLGGLSGLSLREIAQRTPKVLSKVGMEHAAEKELRTYSKGMLQRIGIAQAILHDPEFLILDEPMSGLDPVGRQEMRDLLIALHAEGKTLLFSTHLLEDAESLCHEVALIRDGKLDGFGPLAKIAGHGAREFEIRLSGLAIESLRGALPPDARIEAVPGGVRVRASDADSVLRIALEKGGSVRGVEEFRPSMEVFFRGKGHA